MDLQKILPLLLGAQNGNGISPETLLNLLNMQNQTQQTADAETSNLMKQNGIFPNDGKKTKTSLDPMMLAMLMMAFGNKNALPDLLGAFSQNKSNIAQVPNRPENEKKAETDEKRQESDGHKNEEKFSEIKSFSGEEIVESLKILTEPDPI